MRCRAKTRNGVRPGDSEDIATDAPHAALRRLARVRLKLGQELDVAQLREWGDRDVTDRIEYGECVVDLLCAVDEVGEVYNLNVSP